MKKILGKYSKVNILVLKFWKKVKFYAFFRPSKLKMFLNILRVCYVYQNRVKRVPGLHL